MSEEVRRELLSLCHGPTGTHTPQTAIYLSGVLSDPEPHRCISHVVSKALSTHIVSELLTIEVGE